MQYENFITYHLGATTFEVRLDKPKMALKRCFWLGTKVGR